MAKIDKIEEAPFAKRDGDDLVKIVDLSHVIDLLVVHFGEADSGLPNDLNVDLKVELA